MSYKIKIEVDGAGTHSVEAGTPVSSLLPAGTAAEPLPYLAALVNNDVASLSYPLSIDCSVKFLTMADPHGWRVYRQSLCFLLAKAVFDLYPDARFSIEHSFGLGLYCSFQEKTDDPGISTEKVNRLSDRMKQLVRSAHPIERRKVAYSEAVSAFSRTNQQDKLSLLENRNQPHIVLHFCGEFCDLAHGPLAQNTSMINKFELIPYAPGFVLHLPDRSDPLNIPEFQDQPHLFRIFKEHKQWGRILGVNTAGRLNRITADNEISDFININEALHEKKIAVIADTIAAAQNRVKIILIAGPSSAGKTTFAKRLTVQLRVNGIRPAVLATDDYFVGPERNPVDCDGKPDFEHIEAVDIELFNKHLLDLIEGRTIEVPTFNFAKKQREYTGRRLSIDSDQVIMIEGIHGLNPRLTEFLPDNIEFRIYISALTQLSLDRNNRISTTDNRLMRRIVRDYLFRGHSALYSLQLWPSVRHGEKKWIFPFQQQAHATFNSALDYELAVLRPFVEPLLNDIKPTCPEYAEARRLSEFLLNFRPVAPSNVPLNSILREYIGGSIFKY